MPTLLTVNQFTEKHHAFTVGGLRAWIFNENTNGLAESGAIIRIGRKVLIDEAKFFAWVTAMTTSISKSSAVSNPAKTIKIPHFVADERGKYRTRVALTEAQIIKAAQVLLCNHICCKEPLTNPYQTRAWLQMQYMDLEHEVFACLFLDNQHCVIAHEVLFRGTIDGASVYPREVAKRALQVNAAALIFIHNHPSGVLEPSPADRSITDKLKQALSLFDVRTLDHFIVSKMGVYSFAEHGLI